MSCLQTLSSNMQSMSTEVRSISSRLERVEEGRKKSRRLRILSQLVQLGEHQRTLRSLLHWSPESRQACHGLRRWSRRRLRIRTDQWKSKRQLVRSRVPEVLSSLPLRTRLMPLFVLLASLPCQTPLGANSLNVLVSLVYHARQPHTWTKSSGQGYLPPSGQGIMSWRRFKLCPSTACFRSVVC